MKKYLVICFVCTFTVAFLTSCEKDGEMNEMAQLTQLDERTSNFTLGDTTVTDYPVAIDDYVAQNYPDSVAIEEVVVLADGNYEVELTDENETELLFDAAGQFLEEVIETEDDDMDGEDDMEGDDEEDEYLQVGEYPASIDEYIAQQYPDAIIEEVELEDDGTYEVELDNELELVFDADGNFVSEEMDDDDDEEDEEEDDEYLQTGEYPAAIDDYVAQNHPTATIEEVELEDDGTYEVELDDGTELKFDATGNFIG